MDQNNGGCIRTGWVCMVSWPRYRQACAPGNPWAPGHELLAFVRGEIVLEPLEMEIWTREEGPKVFLLQPNPESRTQDCKQMAEELLLGGTLQGPGELGVMWLGRRPHLPLGTGHQPLWRGDSRLCGCCKEGGPLPGPENGLLSNTGKWVVRGDTCADKARDFIGKGRPGGEQEGEGTQENCSAMWLAVLGFLVMGLLSGLSFVNHSDSESFLVVHALFRQDGCQREGFREVIRHVPLFWPFLNSSSWWWLISYMFLTRTSCPKTTHANVCYGAWPGWAVSVCVLPLTWGLMLIHSNKYKITIG